MPAPRIKICGVNSAGALDAVIAARAEYCGFVFFERSPRHLALPEAQRLGARAAGHVTKVGLFVDADDATIANAVAAGALDAVQLHGEESPERVALVKAQTGLPVWKAVPIASTADVERAARYIGSADLVLFDAKTPKGTLPGGMGLSFDWSLLAGWKNRVPWGLAGGLSPTNVAEAARLTGAPLVDTSSGVESAPGIKDADKIAAFCKAARCA
ncbi:phosphoribosylanthranilate isomerase [Novosphingobium sp.]|uniref:phosphoribosylanthranilate isomerase n=1 Tax=Novosphingobium sp. TaxID=1874826 RepID=UPI00286D8E40|nr:phosphoribosylanthranilate isomerase [Novosphingobium sp.]